MMRIKKYNESNLTSDMFDELIEDIVEYFYPNDTGSMGIYISNIDKGKTTFYLEFQYHLISMEDLQLAIKVYEYCKSFNNTSQYYIYAENVSDELNVSCFHITINIKKFDELYKDLKMKISAKKYNL